MKKKQHSLRGANPSLVRIYSELRRAVSDANIECAKAGLQARFSPPALAETRKS